MNQKLQEHLAGRLKYFDTLEQSPNWTFVKETNDITVEQTFIPESSFVCLKSNGFVKAKPDAICENIWSYDTFKRIRDLEPTINAFDIIKNLDDNTRICYQRNKLKLVASRDLLYLQTKQVINGIHHIISFSLDYKDPTEFLHSLRTGDAETPNGPNETPNGPTETLSGSIETPSDPPITPTVIPEVSSIESKKEKTSASETKESSSKADAKKYVRAHININVFILTPKDEGTMVCQILHAEPGGLIPAFIVNNFTKDTVLKMIQRLRRDY